MSEQELQKILSYIRTLKELEPDYGHKTLSNVVQGFEQRVKYHNEIINKRRYGI